MKKIIFFALSLIFLSCDGKAQSKKSKPYPVAKTEAEWKAEMSPLQYNVMRQKGTEPPFSSKLNNVKQDGTFVCAACGNPLYAFEHKFDSGTGWPSFDRAIDNKNVDYRPDRTGGFPATEVVCANCGAHLGHVFNDGPRNTTGKRHCINGVALKFIPESK